MTDYSRRHLVEVFAPAIAAMPYATERERRGRDSACRVLAGLAGLGDDSAAVLAAVDGARPYLDHRALTVLRYLRVAGKTDWYRQREPFPLGECFCLVCSGARRPPASSGPA